MLIEIPDHYVSNVAGAMVCRAAVVINDIGFVPAYLHQYADLWRHGVSFKSNRDFWVEVALQHPISERILREEGLI